MHVLHFPHTLPRLEYLLLGRHTHLLLMALEGASLRNHLGHREEALGLFERCCRPASSAIRPVTPCGSWLFIFMFRCAQRLRESSWSYLLAPALWMANAKLGASISTVSAGIGEALTDRPRAGFERTVLSAAVTSLPS